MNHAPAPAMDGAAILAAARALAPSLSARSAAIEQARRLPADVVADLRAAGVFRMAMPASRGGPQMRLTAQIQVLEVLAKADASVGWTVKIGQDSGYFAGVMDPDVADELLPGLDLAIAGFAPPGPGRLDRVEGGYRLNGRFPFGSGSTHADLFFATAMVFEADGKPAQGGQWAGMTYRMAFVTADKVTIEDNWHSTGLSGTGSNHWVAQDLFVPERHALDPFTQIRRRDIPNYAHPLYFTATMAAVPLGIMARAIEEAMAFAAGKTLPFPPPPRAMSEMPQTRGVVAECYIAYRAARALVFETAERFHEALAADGEAPPTLRATIGLATAHACRTACDVTRRLFDLVGTAAIHQDAVMGRLLRDAMTANQHVTVSQSAIEAHGGTLFGVPITSPFS